MQRHVREYLVWMGYDEHDFIPCELTGGKAVDIHHIDCKGMGGVGGDREKIVESIYNLMALTREAHEELGDKEMFKEALYEAHFQMIRCRMEVCPELKRLVEFHARHYDHPCSGLARRVLIQTDL